MLGIIGQRVYNWAISNDPWTNVYGLARSLMAISLAMTLILNEARILFLPAAGQEEYPQCKGNISVFCMVPPDYFYLDIVRWLAIVCLIVVATGWRPRITGMIHWWISYSVQVSAIELDGGEQVAAVLTLLILPIVLTDRRKWHWEKGEEKGLYSDRSIYSRIVALSSLMAIRVQVAILYFHSSVAKMFEHTWINGTAVYYFLQDPMLGLNSFFLYLSKPILTSAAVVVPTWGTLILQLFLFGALFAPKRYWKYFFIAALLLHEVIAVMLGLISFSIAMIAALILYLRPIEEEFKYLNRLHGLGKIIKVLEMISRNKEPRESKSIPNM
ncbi:sporulation-delaying protein SdpB family protein [Salinithrix halophila]|uniref:Sporulation-delaying protein SdpB family protein n=1 Tax=Salinithrix halophila TaxID=1485204 RepID=A0ABV8JFI0_9BACL